jgi:uroporphyrin-III C-methyltransferase
VLFATRHLAAGVTNTLTGIAPDTTLVLYMPGKDYAAIQSELTGNGWKAETQCLIVSSLGTPKQRSATCPLGDLADLAPLPSPVVMLFFPGLSA